VRKKRDKSTLILNLNKKKREKLLTSKLKKTCSILRKSVIESTMSLNKPWLRLRPIEFKRYKLLLVQYLCQLRSSNNLLIRMVKLSGSLSA
jgi:hypothetical protein